MSLQKMCGEYVILYYAFRSGFVRGNCAGVLCRANVLLNERLKVLGIRGLLASVDANPGRWVIFDSVEKALQASCGMVGVHLEVVELKTALGMDFETASLFMPAW